MGMFHWAVGLLVYNIVVFIALIGLSPLLATDPVFNTTDNVAEFNQSAFDDSSIPTDADVSVLTRFSASISGLPWYIDLILFIPNFIYVLLLIFWLRGTN